MVFDLRSGQAELTYLGPALPSGENIATLCDMRSRGLHESQPDNPVPRSLFPQSGQGYAGTPALSLLRDGKSLFTNLSLASVAKTPDGVRFSLVDPTVGISVQVHWWLELVDLVNSEVTLTNIGEDTIAITALPALSLPLPSWATHQTRYAGRWASEMHTERMPIPYGQSGGASFGGRPGFGGANWIRLEEENVSETYGRIIAAHLAWSGDHHLLVERDADGCASVMIGPRIDAGEIILGPTESYTTPIAMFAFTDKGHSGVRDKFHAKANALTPQARTPRKVHLNSWEAVGFDFDLTRLKGLADDASALGVERFVLDDGWFKGRRDDTTSLGDWSPDPQRFPDGLEPLIEHIKSRDMDFGLWVEPEMVSPDSDLYRAHPDWCLHVSGVPRATQRNQLVLNLDRPEVAKALFDRLDSLLCEHDIAYLKWDHNRDLFPVAGQGLAQTRALYALLDKVRAVHPRVEIESCASGGGRVDFEILRRCSRVWASDNNDAIERLRINRSWFQFLPLKVVGNHVGPSPNPITGRRLSMDFRAKAALFGHMGVEADPAAMSDSERKSLAMHIALYKEWRAVLHGGRLTEIESSDPGIFGWLSWTGERGLALVAQTRFADDFNAPPVRLAGLPLRNRYQIRLIEPWPARAARALPNPDQWRAGHIVSGLVLSETGLPLPLQLPETAWLISVETVNE